jgi:hypothetical protein
VFWFSAVCSLESVMSCEPAGNLLFLSLHMGVCWEETIDSSQSPGVCRAEGTICFWPLDYCRPEATGYLQLLDSKEYRTKFSPLFQVLVHRLGPISSPWCVHRRGCRVVPGVFRWVVMVNPQTQIPIFEWHSIQPVPSPCVSEG